MTRSGESGLSPSRAWWGVAVLTGAYVISFVDRQILTLLVGPVRRDLGISDTQMSLLMGLSFAAFYTFAGIPLARLADRTSRRGLIAVGMVLWCACTAACGIATSYTQLLLLRLGVGLGEAALSPAAYSYIADAFPRERRGSAMGVYTLGIYLGGGLAYALGGLVVGAAGDAWQQVLLGVGLAGLAWVVLLATVREPRRDAVAVADRVELMAFLRARSSVLYPLILGVALLALSGYGSGAWFPSLLVRRCGWSAAESGVAYGLLFGIGGTLGVLLGGWLVDRGRGALRVCSTTALLLVPVGLAYPLAREGWLVVLLHAPVVLLVSVPFGLAPVVLAGLAPAHLRAQLTAVYLFAVSLVGLGLGPTLVALATDQLFADEGSLHLSLLVVTTAAHLGAAACFRRSLDAGRRPSSSGCLYEVR